MFTLTHTHVAGPPVGEPSCVDALGFAIVDSRAPLEAATAEEIGVFIVLRQALRHAVLGVRAQQLGRAAVVLQNEALVGFSLFHASAGRPFGMCLVTWTVPEGLFIVDMLIMEGREVGHKPTPAIWLWRAFFSDPMQLAWTPAHRWPGLHLVSCMQVALEIIARSRYEGYLQSNLPKLLKKNPTNFNYTLKRLSTRGLIVKTPVKLRAADCEQSVITHTSLLHHIHFAPSLSPQVVPVRVFC